MKPLFVGWTIEDGLYVAYIPQLPGCMAHGDTLEEALANADIAIENWFETAKFLGRGIPV